MSAFGSHEDDMRVEEIVGRRLARMRNTKIGYVTAYDPHNYAVRLRLEPESTANESKGGKPVETQWLTMHRGFGGNNWGMLVPPNADPNPPYGDMAIALWIDNGGHGVALVGFPNDKERQYSPATQGKNGEFIWANPNGTIVKFLLDGTCEILSSNGSKIKVGSDNSVEMTMANGATFKADSAGALTTKGAGGAGFSIASGAPAANGSTGANGKALVTKDDLQNAVDQVLGRINSNCQSGSGASPAAITVKGSTTIVGSD